MFCQAQNALKNSMSWLEKILPKSKITTPRRHNIPEGGVDQVYCFANRCSTGQNWSAILEVCPKCDHICASAPAPVSRAFDVEGREVAAELEPQDILKFGDSKRYKDRLSAAQKETGEKMRWW